MPAPVGTSRSQTATCGRSFTALLAMVAVAAVNPGDVAPPSRVPAVFVDCTIAMHSPANAFRVGPGIGLVIGGIAVARADHAARPGHLESDRRCP